MGRCRNLPMSPPSLHAVVIAEGPHALGKVAGLTLRERAVRVATRAGAQRVMVIDGPAARQGVTGWVASGAPAALLVVRASDQIVHVPLVAGLVAAEGNALAVAPPDPVASDVPPGGYAGAFLVRGPDVAAVAAALAAGDDDGVIASRLAGSALAVPHGEIARHPATTPDERRAAAKLLYRIVHKIQDNAITRYLFRPVSFPLTKLFLQTPITPNQISYLTGVLVLIGLWFTAQASMTSALIGTVVVLAASYVDCCDGEVARLKLLSSKLGAWLDTIIDELSSIGYMLALGWHCHQYFGRNYFGDLGVDPWIVSMWIGGVAFAWSIYAVYYNIIVVVGSANSQDYVGRFEEVPGAQAGTVVLRPAAGQAIAVDAHRSPIVRFVATYVPYVIRRDFISWAAVLLVALHLTHVTYALLIIGGVGTSVVVAIDHVRLRAQQRSIARRGLRLVIR
jgi:phosphatidylglycerophosphate synthase